MLDNPDIFTSVFQADASNSKHNPDTSRRFYLTITTLRVFENFDRSSLVLCSIRMTLSLVTAMDHSLTGDCLNRARRRIYRVFSSVARIHHKAFSNKRSTKFSEWLFHLLSQHRCVPPLRHAVGKVV